MKRKTKYILLPLVMLLTACNNNNISSSTSSIISSSSSSISSSSLTSSSSISSSSSFSYTSSINHVISLQLKNVIDGFIEGASFKVDGKEIAYEYKDETYFLKNIAFDSTLEIIHSKYANKKITITSENLGLISLEYPYVKVGSARFNSNILFNNWTLLNSRGLNEIKFQFVSPYNHFVGSNSSLNLYINTGNTSTSLRGGDYEFKMTSDKLFVYDYGFVHDGIDLDQFNYINYVEDGKTYINIDIPYNFLKINYDDIVGVNFIENLVDADIVSNLIFDEKEISTINTTSYPRIDATGRVFANNRNVDDPMWISKAQYKELIEGKDYSFASPKYNKYPGVADDVHFSVDYQDSLRFNFVGFGKFADTEYFQIVIHNNIIDKNSWNLTPDDVIFHIYKDRVEIYNQCTEFFAVQNKKENHLSTIKIDNYIDYGPYFTMNIDVPFDQIPNIHSEYDDIYIMAVEFDEKTLYEGTNYYENFFYKGKTLGDPADMISYACIDAPKVRESNLTNEEKKKLIGNRKISFANPEDTSNKKADDVYMNIERKENGLSFDLVGFGDFKDTEIFTFVFHTSNENGENWKIQNDDVTLMVSQTVAKFVTGTTDFWVGTRITRSNITTKNAVEYKRYDGYFTLTLDIDYDEIKASLNKDSILKMYAFEFGFGGVMYNNEPWTKLMRYDGEPCGDPAFQINYLNI
jgi:lipoprotein